MPAFIISFAARLFGERFARAGAIATLIVAALAAIGVARLSWSIWLRAYDRSVIAVDRADANAQASGAVLAAERAAGASKERRDREFADEQAQLKEKADAAANDGSSPLDALFDQLR
jgi:hypothetical protein